MIISKTIRVFIAAASLALAASASRAATITFNGVVSSGNALTTTLTTDGFTLAGSHFHIIDSPGSSSFGGDVSNGTIFLSEEAGGLGAPVTMTKVGGGTFSLLGLDGAPPFIDAAAAAAAGFPNAVTLDVLGNLSGGGTVDAHLSLVSGTFTTFSLPGTFTNLSSVTFSGISVTGGAGGISFDNLVVGGPATPTPLPSAASGGLVSIAGLGMFAALRRKSR